MNSSNEVRSPEGDARFAPIFAVLFAVSLVVGLLMSGMANDTSNKSDDEVLKLFHDHKGAGAAAAYFFAFAGLVFLPLAWTLIRRVAVGLSPLAEQIARWTAVLFVAMVFAGGMTLSTLALTAVFGNEKDPSADLIRFLPQLGYPMLLIAGGLSVGVFLAVVSRAGQRSATLPKWHVIIGYVAAVAMLVAPLFVPMVLIPIWAIASAVALRRPAA
jgi:hypothetical protein